MEPRKRYDQVLEAFNILWQKGIDVNLEIVGRPGWKTEETISIIENSKYLNKKLFWHKNFISDKELSALYANCTAVLFATEAEGFGLPVIEASLHNKPLILRDLPIFKEIAKESAFYFSGFEAENLSCAIENWLTLYKQNKIPLPNIKANSWEESTEMICKKLGILEK